MTNIINANSNNQGAPNFRDFNLETTELTRRLKSEEKAALAAKLASLPQKGVGDLVAALSIQNWDAPIFNDPHFPLYALEACHQKLITPAQFGTVQLYWSALQYHGKENVDAAPLFQQDGSVIPQAWDAIKETLYLNSQTNSAEAGLYDPAVPLLNDQELAEFFRRVRQLPLSEQQLFIVEDVIPIGNGPTISETIYQSIGYNIFCRNFEHGARMIPSIGMMQEFLNVRFGDSAVQINPVLGHSSLEDIRQNGLNGTRDMAVHFPGVELPDEADGFLAPWYDFTFHDFYHAILASGAPAKYRPLLIKVADIAKTLLQRTPNLQDKALLTKVHEEFIDMEQSEYRWEVVTSLSKKIPERAQPHLMFWRAVTSSMIAAMRKHEDGMLNIELLTQLYTKIAQELPLEPSLQKDFSEFAEMEIKDLQSYDLDEVSDEMYQALTAVFQIGPSKIMSSLWQERLSAFNTGLTAVAL
jgi:hypothetical protein